MAKSYHGVKALMMHRANCVCVIRAMGISVLACTPGSYSNTVGVSQCLPCPQGSYTNDVS